MRGPGGVSKQEGFMKGRAFIVHWNVREAVEYAQHLYEDDWSVEFEAVDGRRAFDLVVEEQPDVVVIYLSRLHVQGRAVADELHTDRATRDIPIVFVDGKDKAVNKAMEEIPDAIHTTQDDLLGELLRFRARKSGETGGSGLQITDIKTVKWGDVTE
jgi:CheY-like chemotaxis protein